MTNKFVVMLGVFLTWESSCQAACAWEWLLVTSATVGPVRTGHSDCESTTGRLCLECNKNKWQLSKNVKPKGAEF